MLTRHRFALWASLVFFSFCADTQAWTPGTSNPTALDGFSVDTTDRIDVLSYYNTVYSASQNYAADMDWTGDIATDTPGTTSLTFKNDVLRRVNFYRALDGLTTDITFSDADSADDQLDALMSSVNNQLNHFPPTSFIDYTAGGATAAGNSNLALGAYGPGAIDGYMVDNGSNNTEVGHRRWIMYTQANVMGTGDIPPNGTYNAANSLWVIGDFNTSAPAQFVEWPNSGYCPFPLMPARWSLSYPNADFSAATVTMTQGGTSIPVTITSSTDNGYGDNTLVWAPTTLPTSISADTTYNITVSGIGGIPGTTSYSYAVTLFDPTVLGESVAITGSSTPPVIGSSYTFNSIEEADAYDLQVSTGSTATWDEGAEPSPAPQVSYDTTGSYPVIESAVVHTGSDAFQLTFPDDVDGNGNYQNYDFSNQSFEITRQIVPTASSQLQFYDLFHYVTSTATLSAQVSTDNGNSWTSVWSAAGGTYATAWTQNNVSLAAYAGQVILVQFVLNANGGSVYLGTTSQFGVFLDDITVTNSTQLTNITDTTLAGSATSFMLNSATAGAGLQVGTKYYLRIRPEVGLTWYPYGAFDLVTAQASAVTGYSSWISTTYPAITGGVSGDDSGDGIPNGLKYAFGLNPTVHNSPSAIPQPVVTSTTITLSFTAPTGIVGVTYGAQSSSDLVNWTSITDTGTGSNHIFTVNVSGTRMFMHQTVTIAP